MLYRYRAVVQQSISREPGITYGLLGEKKEGAEWHTVAIIPAVSCDEALVSRLADRGTERQLNPGQMLETLVKALRF